MTYSKNKEQEEIQNMNYILVNLLKKVVSVYNLILIITGSLTNILTLITCLQKDIRKISTFRLYAFNAISDTLNLYPWNIGQFVWYFLGTELGATYLWWCIGAAYIQFTTFELSAWLLVTFKIQY